MALSTDVSTEITSGDKSPKHSDSQIEIVPMDHDGSNDSVPNEGKESVDGGEEAKANDSGVPRDASHASLEDDQEMRELANQALKSMHGGKSVEFLALISFVLPCIVTLAADKTCLNSQEGW